MKKNLKKIPQFKNEDDERKFWATHDSTPYLDWSNARRALFPNLKPTKSTISLRLPEWLLARLKNIANQKDLPYQSLMKLYLAERVERELKTAA